VAGQGTDDRPLAGVRVFELSIAIAGPTCGRYLAHFGADVIRAESRRNPDPVRVIGSAWVPMDDPSIGDARPDTSPMVNEYSAGKRCIGLDLKTDGGREVARRLLPTCDVFLTNYSGPALKDLGLDYEGVRALRPDVIYVAMHAFGAVEDAPYYDYVAWGPNQAPLTGLDDLTGYPGEAPAAIAAFGYPDYSSGLYAVLATCAALEWRDRTGEGQLCDVSQFEATVSLLGPILLDHERNDTTPARMGNRLEWSAPEGVYPCSGDDRWVAISAYSEEAWRALAEVAGHPEWLADTRFFDMAARVANHDALDEVLSDWTRNHTADEVATWLQAAGVAAGPVMDPPAILADTHVAQRGFWLTGAHARVGEDLVTGNAIKLHDTPGWIERAGPSLGEDNADVLGDVCGYTDEEQQALVDAGAVFPMAAPDLSLQRPYRAWAPAAFPHLPWSRGS